MELIRKTLPANMTWGYDENNVTFSLVALFHRQECTCMLQWITAHTFALTFTNENLN